MNEVTMFRRFILFCLLIDLQFVFSQSLPTIAAGVPKSLAETGEFDKIFHTLHEAGVTVFLPHFQYQEAPVVKSLELDAYFMPPCQPLSAPLKSMMQAKVKMLVPGEIYYPQVPTPLPSEDPLQALLDCLGDDGIYGVYSYDEPGYNGVSLESVKRLYERVKSIDPNLPVLMIHRPMLTDDETMQTQEQREAYLNNVKEYSQYADIVGFDVYPIPQHIAKVATPYSSDETKDYRLQLADYLKWLQVELPTKHHALVLQGFSYTHLYEESFLKENVPSQVLDTVRPPTREELSEMVKVAEAYNAQVIWWGQSLLKEADMALWNDILFATRQAQ
jgi:hypothetical protein